MGDRLFVGTRKGLFEYRRAGDSWRFARHSFLGDPVSAVLADPAGGAIYAALALGHFGVKLRRSIDGGQSWTDIVAPALPSEPGNAAAPGVSLIWTIERGGDGKLWIGTIPGALFESADAGESWRLVESLWNRPERQKWMGGGYDQPGIHTICIHPGDARRLVLGVSTGGVWRSDDGGAAWRLEGRGLYAEYAPPEQRDDPLVQDVHRIAQCAARPERLWLQHHNGVFVSSDRGDGWSDVPAIVPSKFGFAVVAHPRDPDTAWFVPAVKDECRVPVGAALAVARTQDGGRTFQALRRGLPQENAYDLVYRHGLAVDETGARLAFGSTTGHLWHSTDGGESWSALGANLPPIACLRFA